MHTSMMLYVEEEDWCCEPARFLYLKLLYQTCIFVKTCVNE